MRIYHGRYRTLASFVFYCFAAVPYSSHLNRCASFFYQPTMSTSHTRVICEEIPPQTSATLDPSKNQKIVHLVRHGQGTHNVFSMRLYKEGRPCACSLGNPGCPLVNEELFDARLTPIGKQQAAAAGAAILQSDHTPEFIFVSPLYRTLQTCVIALSKFPGLNHVPVVAEETIRERNGVHHCDKRSPKEEVENVFSRVDFKNIKPGSDSLFSNVRETEQDLAARGKKFFLTLRDRPENCFAVFSHSSFLYNTLSKAFETPDENAARRFQTGEKGTQMYN